MATKKEDLVQISVQEYEKLQSDASMGNVARGLAHDMNNILAVLAGSVQLLQMDGKKMPNDKLYSTMGKAVNKGVNLTKGYLTKLKCLNDITEKDIDINHVIDSEFAMISMDKKYNHIEIESDLDAKLPHLPIVPYEACQLIQNLTSNAAEAMHSTDEGVMKVMTQYRDGNIELRIRDNGCGIPQDDMPNIFDDQFTGKTDVEKHGRIGNGIGLALVKSIADKYEATIDVESEEGLYTEFKVTFPVESSSFDMNRLLAQETLPAMPGTMSKMRSVMNFDSSTPIEKILGFMKSDPAIGSKLLTIANSAYYNTMGSVDSIDDAVVRLGINEVKRLCMDVFSYSMFESAAKDIDMKDHSDKSLMMANASYEIAENMNMSDMKEKAYTAALMADIGTLVMVEAYPSRYQDALGKYETLASKTEKKEFGLTHQEVSAEYVDKNVNMENDVVDAIRYHHDEKSANRLSRVLGLANLVIENKGEIPVGSNIVGQNKKMIKYCKNLYKKVSDRVSGMQDIL